MMSNRLRIRRVSLKAGGHFWHIACPCGWWGSTPTGPEIADLATKHRAVCPPKEGKP